jgi:5-hydroxyisourate hydrolase
MSVSLQVLDCAYGRPAVGMPVRLDRQVDGQWREQFMDRTDGQGYLTASPVRPLERGVYRLVLDVGCYFAAFGSFSPFPSISVDFRAVDSGDSAQVSVIITRYAYFVNYQN